LLVGANAAAEPARRERAAIFIMVAVFEFIPCCCEAVHAVKHVRSKLKRESARSCFNVQRIQSVRRTYLLTYNECKISKTYIWYLLSSLFLLPLLLLSKTLDREPSCCSN
jgi:hypothetical protein